jgi:peroxiredoxin
MRSNGPDDLTRKFFHEKGYLMTRIHALRNLGLAAACLLGLAVPAVPAQPSTADAEPSQPTVGDEAKDFELENLAGKSVKLSESTKNGPVVLVVLRGYPGYQCPLCTQQVAQFVTRAQEFRDKRATVLLVYPGPATGLKLHADEFVNGKSLPENFQLLLDPDFKFTKSYHLRWDVARETAYPATFVIDMDRKVRLAKVSKSHGDRAQVADVLKALPARE